MRSVPAERGAVRQEANGAHALRKPIGRRVRRLFPPQPEAILREPGKPLDPGIRRDMEAQLGYDFGRVRVHSDEGAAAITALIGADAVAVGSEILFADKTYRPETQQGRRLLAHELLHTVQAPMPSPALRNGVLTRSLDPVERQAEA